MKNYYFLNRLLLSGLLILTMNRVAAQSSNPVIKITYPESRAVFQRENDNTSTIYLSGSYYQTIDSVQARVQAEVTGQGIDTDWATVQRSPQGGVFQGSLRAKGGWYRLEVRVYAGGQVVGSDVIRKIGIGEVFIITGQSNAQGFQGYGAVGAADDRVNCVTYDNSTANSLADPPAPAFQQLSANSLIGPRGQSAWCWGVLGDLIARQYQVPVLFINTAWAGTVIKNWRESSEGKITKNIFAIGTPNENFPTGMPYANLVIALRYYCSLQGLRAVLWQQGESDNLPLNATRVAYRDDMQFIVNKTRADTDRYPAWVLARSSFNLGKVNQDIIQAQNDVINTYNNNVFAGPFTDNIQTANRRDDVHFSDDGLRQLGQAWFESLNPVFFASSRPLLPLAQPTISVACGSANNSLTLQLPSIFRGSYTWNQGSKTQIISISQPGQYRATLKDQFGNTFLSPLVDVQGSIRPATPTISLASQAGQPAGAQQQVCADSALSLVANVAANSASTWSTGRVGNAISVNQSGTYSVQATNIYGCKSAASSAINLTVRSRVPTPAVEQVGTYSLEAILPTPTGGQADQFDWRRAGELIPQSGPIVKVVITANYTARAKTNFTLGSSTITCYSAYSTPRAFSFDPADGGLSVYPNPSVDGRVTIETIENLADAQVDVYSMTGQRLFTNQVPLLDARKALDLSGLAPGEYIIRVLSGDFNVSQRVILNR